MHDIIDKARCNNVVVTEGAFVSTRDNVRKKTAKRELV